MNETDARYIPRSCLFRGLLVLTLDVVVVISTVIVWRQVRAGNAEVISAILITISAALLFIVPTVIFLAPRQPRWVTQVQQDGKPFPARILNNRAANPDYYRGADVWLEIPIQVKPADGAAYNARMTCRYSDALNLSLGSEIKVKIDTARPERIVLAR